MRGDQQADARREQLAHERQDLAADDQILHLHQALGTYARALVLLLQQQLGDALLLDLDLVGFLARHERQPLHGHL